MTPEPSSPDPILRLLILLARLELSETQQREALALCASLNTWSDVTHRAQRQFILPLVYRHLRRLSPPSLSQNAAAYMRDHVLAIVQHNLHVAAEQQRLVGEILEPLAIPHLFFKGPALATRYYDEPAMRFCRDIDLLVPRERITELLLAALKRGYQPRNPARLASDRNALNFAVRTQPIINIITPQGVEIELHSQLDKKADIYNTEALISARELLQVSDSVLRVMPTHELFVYICLHHTRHYWSHLHWLVDMDAIQRHPDFNLAAVYACAETRGLTATVDASLELYSLLAKPNFDDAAHELSEHGRSLYDACMVTLKGGLEVEWALRRRRPAPEFAFSWQTTATYRIVSRFRRWTPPLLPKYNDYAIWPLPPRWQWLYYLTSPWRALFERITSRRSSQ